MDADLLVRNATVVTVDPRDTVLTGASVAVRGPTVVAVGDDAEVAAVTRAAAVVDAGGGILMPGLVNAHSHLAMTLFRGLADDRDLQGFLGIVLPAEASVLDADTVRVGVRLAIAESIRAGCTSALDMYFWPEAAQQVASETGFRLLAGPVMIGAEGPDRRPWSERLAWAADVLAATDGARWVMPHSTYLLDPGQLAEVADLADRVQARVHVHASENDAEVADVRARYGGTPIEVLERTGLLGRGTTIAHGVAVDDDDIGRIARAGAHVTHCPASNLKLASGFCRTVEITAAGITLALGTDGSASANDLDLFLAMRLAAVVDPAYRGTPTEMDAARVLRAATMGGAVAAGIDHVAGSVEVGKQADLVLLDADSPALTPSPDPVSTIVYSASRADVRSVWIAGRPVLLDRVLTTVDLASTLDDARRAGDRVRSVVGRPAGADR